MKKIFQVLIVIFLVCNPVFAQSSFQPYTKHLSNKPVDTVVIEFEDNNIKIARNKYKLDFGLIKDDKVSIYEYLIINKTEKPIMLKKMIAPDRITQVTTTSYTFHNTPNDLLVNAASCAYDVRKSIILDKFFQSLPSDYLINAKDTTRILFLAKTYINPLVEFQFIVNGSLKEIKSSVAYIVKDNKYYQSIVDAQNAKDKDIDVIYCVKNNDVALVEAYMKTGINPNNNLYFFSLLQYALKAGNPKTVDVLLKAGANPNLQNMGMYPLTQAIRHNQPEMAKMLIDAGANPKQICLGTSPLIWAIINKQPEIVELLIIRGADPNDKYLNKTALAYAIKTKQAKVVDCLINAGAIVDKKAAKYANKSKDEYIKNLVLSKLK